MLCIKKRDERTDGRKDGRSNERTNAPEAICPSNFFEDGGIINQMRQNKIVNAFFKETVFRDIYLFIYSFFFQ